MIKWVDFLKANWKFAGICVVLCLGALVLARDGCMVRNLLQQRTQELKAEKEAKAKELQEAQQVFTEAQKPLLKERDALRAKLAKLGKDQAAPWIPPATDNDVVGRFGALGYKIGVQR